MTSGLALAPDSRVQILNDPDNIRDALVLSEAFKPRCKTFAYWLSLAACLPVGTALLPLPMMLTC